MRRSIALTVFAMLALVAVPAEAGKADVVDVRVTKTAKQTYRFEVTVRHADAGWKHYADAWEVVGPDGKVIARRILLHPHDTEQPFTRSLGGVKIPDAIHRVTVRAHDKEHGLGGRTFAVDLPR